jgi:hypothetical protein
MRRTRRSRLLSVAAEVAQPRRLRQLSTFTMSKHVIKNKTKTSSVLMHEWLTHALRSKPKMVEIDSDAGSKELRIKFTTQLEECVPQPCRSLNHNSLWESLPMDTPSSAGGDRLGRSGNAGPRVVVPKSDFSTFFWVRKKTRTRQGGSQPFCQFQT